MPLRAPSRLDVGAANRLDRGGERALEAEAAIDEVDVVVDGLRDADHRDEQAAPLDLGDDLDGAAQRAVAADDEQRADAQRLQPVDHLDGILAAARRPQHGPALLVNLAHPRRAKPHGVVAVARHHAFEAVAKAEDVLHAVGMRELQDQPADDVVDAGTQAAARDDPAPQRRRIEEDAIARAGNFEGGDARVWVAVARRQAVIQQHPLGRAHPLHRAQAQASGQRRFLPARAQDLDLEVLGLDPLGALRDGQVLSGRKH